MEINYPKEGDELPFNCFDTGRFRCGYTKDGTFYLYEKVGEKFLSMGSDSEKLIQNLFKLNPSVRWIAVVPPKQQKSPQAGG